MKNISTALTALLLFSLSGCVSTQNPFGVGYEHSTCEVSAGFGVCGSPMNIYRYKDKIKEIQTQYLKSGIDQDLFFSINDEGRVLVKSERGGRWKDYESSKWKEIIENPNSRFESNKSFFGKFFSKNEDMPRPRDLTLSQARDTRDDLAIEFKKRQNIISSRTNIGNIIRDNGTVQKVWVAPYVDKKGDLISAHHVYTVVKEPRWIIGETPNIRIPKRTVNFPTPMSEEVLEGSSDTSYNETIEDYSAGLETTDYNDVPPPPPEPISDPDSNEIKNFLGE